MARVLSKDERKAQREAMKGMGGVAGTPVAEGPRGPPAPPAAKAKPAVPAEASAEVAQLRTELAAAREDGKRTLEAKQAELDGEKGNATQLRNELSAAQGDARDARYALEDEGRKSARLSNEVNNLKFDLDTTRHENANLRSDLDVKQQELYEAVAKASGVAAALAKSASAPKKPGIKTRIVQVAAAVVLALGLGILIGKGPCGPTKPAQVAQVDCKPVPCLMAAAAPKTNEYVAPRATVAPQRDVTPAPAGGPPVVVPAKAPPPERTCGNGIIDKEKGKECDTKSKLPNKGCDEDKRCNSRCKCVPKKPEGTEDNKPVKVGCKVKDAKELKSAQDKRPYSQHRIAVHNVVTGLKSELERSGVEKVRVMVLVCPPGNKAGVASAVAISGPKGDLLNRIRNSLNGKDGVLRTAVAEETIHQAVTFTETVTVFKKE